MRVTDNDLYCKLSLPIDKQIPHKYTELIPTTKRYDIYEQSTNLWKMPIYEFHPVNSTIEELSIPQNL